MPHVTFDFLLCLSSCFLADSVIFLINLPVRTSAGQKFFSCTYSLSSSNRHSLFSMILPNIFCQNSISLLAFSLPLSILFSLFFPSNSFHSFPLFSFSSPFLSISLATFVGRKNDCKVELIGCACTKVLFLCMDPRTALIR